MTATEVRADALMFLADINRDGYDVTPALLGMFTGIDPCVYRVEWQLVCELVAEVNDIGTGRWDDVEPLSRIRDPYARCNAALELAAETRKVAYERAIDCVMVATRHAASKYVGSAA